MASELHDGARRVTNSSPVSLPVIGLGTWEGNPDNRDELEEAVHTALKEGYRHIDTATVYESEQAVGNAIRRSGVPRGDIVVTTKIWNQLHNPEGVKWSLEQSLKQLQFDYVDLLLIHWPVAFKRSSNFEKVTDKDGKPVIDHELTNNHEPTWRALEDLVDSGKVRSIGVSNFTIPQLEKILAYARIKPACNQVECHPYLPQNKLLDFCNKHNITMTDYSPLGTGKIVEGQPRLRDDPTVAKAAKQLGVEPAQILIAWAVQRGTVPLPKSANASRIKSNFKVPVLPDGIFQEISNISVNDPNRQFRYVNIADQWGVDLFEPGSGQ